MKTEEEMIEGYINIFKNDGLLSTGLAIYKEKVKAEGTGKTSKWYITTTPISFKVPKNILNKK